MVAGSVVDEAAVNTLRERSLQLHHLAAAKFASMPHGDTDHENNCMTDFQTGVSNLLEKLNCHWFETDKLFCEVLGTHKKGRVAHLSRFLEEAYKTAVEFQATMDLLVDLSQLYRSNGKPVVGLASSYILEFKDHCDFRQVLRRRNPVEELCVP